MVPVPTSVAVMMRLTAAPGVSGAAVADELGVTRAAVHKAIRQLRQRGFVIRGSAGQGYRLLEVPDRLCAEAVVPRLSTGSCGQAGWLHEETLPSTNTRAVEWARQGAPDGAVVVAEGQSGGRGRRGRSFASPAGAGIYLSVVLRPSLPVSHAPRLTLCAGLAVVEVCRALGVAAGLKWPNDVWCSGRKLCGVLTEMSADAEGIHHAVVGIGLNVNTRMDQFPPEVRALATSLALERGAPVDRVAVCAHLLDALTTWYHASLLDFPRVLQAARERSVTLGRRVVVKDTSAEVAGEAVDFDNDGALLLRTGQGIRRVVGGDVEPVD